MILPAIQSNLFHDKKQDVSESVDMMYMLRNSVPFFIRLTPVYNKEQENQRH